MSQNNDLFTTMPVGKAVAKLAIPTVVSQITLAPTKDYLLYVFVIGGIPTVAGLSLGHLVRAVGKTREAGIGLALGGILNIILDPIFIFVFHMNVAGAAVTTGLSNLISMLYFLFVLFRMRQQSCITIAPKQFTLQKRYLWVPCR